MKTLLAITLTLTTTSFALARDCETVAFKAAKAVALQSNSRSSSNDYRPGSAHEYLKPVAWAVTPLKPLKST